jgi:cytochrome c oxidase subunit 3
MLGMWVFLGSEALLFAGLFALYAAYRAMYGDDFLAALKHNTLWYGTTNTFILLTSSLTVALTIWAARHGRWRWIVGLLLATIAQGLAFLFIKGFEYLRHAREGALPGPWYHMAELPTFGANRFYTLYWVMTSLHALHVTAGILVLAWMCARAWQRAYTVEHHTTLEMGTLYWHLVDLIWIFLWPLLYLS